VTDWNDQWGQRMKRDIAADKFGFFRAKWTMTSKRRAFEAWREIQNASAILGQLREPVAVNTIR
jgi:P2-related tail formation protein